MENYVENYLVGAKNRRLAYKKLDTLVKAVVCREES